MNDSLADSEFDLAVIGAGINGCGIARDAAGRGLRVLLCDQSDLGSATSSSSTKLIHGGLRYLEHYEFRLVRESLSEREVLWRMAPHLISPMRFILPHGAGMRPAWMIRLGLFLYDHLGSRQKLPKSGAVRFAADSPLTGEFTRGFEYSDCWVDDARLVTMNALDAYRRGARVAPRTRCIRAVANQDGWQVELQPRDADGGAGQIETIRAKTLINATGPWVSQFVDHALDRASLASPPLSIRMVQGSHIVVPKLFDHDQAYLLQNADGRVVFAIPYENDFSLVGTTDHDYRGDPAESSISNEEVDYLLDVVERYFAKSLLRDDIVWSYSGVRPLYDEAGGRAQDASRDYLLKLESSRQGPPILSVYGGKLTTYRRLAEAALAMLANRHSNMTSAWTTTSHLPGGDMALDGAEAIAAALRSTLGEVVAGQAQRLARSYGTLIWDIVADCQSVDDLGHHFGHGLTEREVEHLIDNEWARTSDDILWRRTKLGLRFSEPEAAQLSAWLQARASGAPTRGKANPETAAL